MDKQPLVERTILFAELDRCQLELGYFCVSVSFVSVQHIFIAETEENPSPLTLSKFQVTENLPEFRCS